MAQKVKVITAEPADLSSIPEWSHIVTENWLPGSVSGPHVCAVACTFLYIHTDAKHRKDRRKH